MNSPPALTAVWFFQAFPRFSRLYKLSTNLYICDHAAVVVPVPSLFFNYWHNGSRSKFQQKFKSWRITLPGLRMSTRVVLITNGQISFAAQNVTHPGSVMLCHGAFYVKLLSDLLFDPQVHPTCDCRFPDPVRLVTSSLNLRHYPQRSRESKSQRTWGTTPRNRLRFSL